MKLEQQRRLSKQQQQEYISRDHLATIFDEIGWVPESISRDLGEDFLVHIFDKGFSSGLDFYIQLKSTEDLLSFRVSDGNISYPLKVKDLEHWDISAVPVFVFVWDVGARTGHWTSVGDAIKNLDERTPNWRDQKTTKIRIPRSNGTDDVGLRKLREGVAHYYYPLISKDKPIEIKAKFVFPDTSEGRVVHSAFVRHFTAGDPVNIDGQFIQELEFSEWWTRLFGKIDPSKGYLSLGPAVSEELIPMQLDMIPRSGATTHIPYVEFRVIKQGSEEITLSNEHQPTPLHFQFVFRRPDRCFTMSVKATQPGINVEETKRVVMFISALAKGGKLRMTRLQEGTHDDFEIPEGGVDAPDPDIIRLIDRLCLIQQKTGCNLSLPSDWSSPSKDDFRAIDELIAILDTGRTDSQNMTVTLTVEKAGLEMILERIRDNKPIDLKLVSEDGWIELLGAKVALGPFTQYVNGVLDISSDEIEKETAKMEPGDEMKVAIVNAQVVEEFPNWMGENKEE